MGIFDKQREVSREQLRKTLRRDDGYIEGGEGKYDKSQREKIGKEILPISIIDEKSIEEVKNILNKIIKEKTI